MQDYVNVLYSSGRMLVLFFMSLYSLARLTSWDALTFSTRKGQRTSNTEKDSLNALECRLTGFKMDEIIHEDLQVSGGLLMKEALLLACICNYL